jgi:hypothetical protein
MKAFCVLLLVVAALGEARAQSLIHGKDPAGSAASSNPVVIGGVGSTGQAVKLKLNDDGTLEIGGISLGDVTVSQAGAANAAGSQVAASTTAGTLVVARATRRTCLVRNLDAAITVYIGPAGVSVNNGMPIRPGESVVVSAVTLWQVIAASGAPIVATLDEYD